MNTESTESSAKLIALLKRHPLAYRHRLHCLSSMAQRMVYMFESGASGDDVIDLIARRHYHTGQTNFVTDGERGAAEAEFASLIDEIRRVLIRDV